MSDAKTYVPGEGPLNPKIMFIGESPGHEELLALKPFVGASGKLLNSLLSDVGISRSNCWVTNVCKYFVPPNAKGGRQIPFQVRAHQQGIDLNVELENLKKEILALQPNIIVPLGGTALWACTGKSGIEDWRGSILSGIGGIKSVGSYHPAHILYSGGEAGGYWAKNILQTDLVRVKKQSEFKEIKLPQRSLKVIQSPHEFQEFINRNSQYQNPAIDIEAWQCIPICVGIAFTPHDGVCIPLWNCFGISSIPTSGLATLYRMLSDFLGAHDIVGQNIGYDRDKLKRFGFAIRRIHSDTLLKAFAIYPELPKNLAFLTSVYTEEPFYKNEGMYEGELKDLLLGCARDACCTKEVDINTSEELRAIGTEQYYKNFLLPLQVVYAGIENKGIALDDEFRKEVVKKYVEMDEDNRYALYQIAGHPVNVNSWKQVGKLLYEEWKLPERQGTGEEVLSAILNTKYIDNKPDYAKGIELILEGRKIRKTLSSYAYAMPDFDGRMRTSYFLCLDTGRSSTNQQDPPIRPDIEYVTQEEGKKIKKHQSRGMAFQTITKHGDIGADIRKMLIPDPGHIFLQADSEQAETRVVFLLAEDYDALELLDKIDYHAYTTSWFFPGTMESYSKKLLGYEVPERFIGKTLRHAFHLGAKARRAALTVNTDARKYKINVTITERKAEDALRTLHSMQPKIRNVFHNGIINCLERDRSLVAPVPYGINAPQGGKRIFFERWGDELFRQAFSSLPQRIVSENTKGAALRIKGCEEHEIKGSAPWIDILIESHDALLVSVPIERKHEAAAILKREFERPIDFSTCSLKRGELSIPCEVEEGYNYKDLKKFKWIVEERLAV